MSLRQNIKLSFFSLFNNRILRLLIYPQKWFQIRPSVEVLKLQNGFNKMAIKYPKKNKLNKNFNSITVSSLNSYHLKKSIRISLTEQWLQEKDNSKLNPSKICKTFQISLSKNMRAMIFQKSKKLPKEKMINFS